MDNRLLDIVVLLNKSDLSGRNKFFILLWFMACSSVTFGFLGVDRLEDQFAEAVKFLKQTQLYWQVDLQDNKTEDTFVDYFYKKSVEEGLNLPEDFIKQFTKISQGDLNELERTM